MRPIGKFRGQSTRGEPSTCLGDYSLALVRLQVQFSLFQNLPLDLSKRGVPSRLASRSTAARAGAIESRRARPSNRGRLDVRARRIGVGEERSQAVASRIRLQAGRASSLAAARQAAITSSSLRDESACSRLAAPRPSPVAQAHERRRRERVARLRASSSSLGSDVRLAEPREGGIAAAFQARSLLVCQIRLSSGIAFGSPIAASASTASSRRAACERCSMPGRSRP